MFNTKEHIVPFPSYLFPIQPFLKRRRGDRNAAVSPTNKDSDTKKSFLTTSPSSSSYLRCATCALNICKTSQIISKGFTGRHGRAYLVSDSDSSSSSTPPPSLIDPKSIPSLPNTVAQKAVPRQLVTGAHTVSDIVCQSCNTVLGWKYVAAEEDSQKYKVGKFILETERICTTTCWDARDEDEDEDDDGGSLGDRYVDGSSQKKDKGDVEFDSEDEDECEDLFSGTWSPKLALWRRSRRFPPKGA